MRVMYQRVAGLDVHKKTVVACRMQVTSAQRIVWETRTFGTLTRDLLQLHDWGEWAVVQVALESTGDYWKPVFNLLEESYEVVLVNAQHVKKVPGRKTDVSDAEWLAELMLPGLLRGEFYPGETPAGVARVDAVSPHAGPGTRANREPDREVAGRHHHQVEQCGQHSDRGECDGDLTGVGGGG